MIQEIDLWRCAYLLLQHYGDQAETEAATRAERLQNAGDQEGASVWRRIRQAIEDLKPGPPPKDTSVH